MRCRHGCFSSFARSGGIEVRCGSPGQGYGKGFYGSYAWPATCFDSTAHDASEWGMGQASLGCNVIPLRREVIRLLLLVLGPSSASGCVTAAKGATSLP